MSDGWGEYQRLVLAELERLDKSVKELHSKVEDLRGDVKVLYFKSGMWGAVAGLIPGVLALIYMGMKP